MDLEDEIKRQLENWKKEVVKIDKSILPLADKFIKANEGGKRIRGRLVMLGSSVKGQASSKEILKIAAAYEIFHTAILVHDDIIDKSTERRGRPSLYKAVGIPLAICLADAGFFLATRIISESNFPEKEKNNALKYFSNIMLDTAMGQIMDIEKADPLKVAKYKTAKYTVSGPLILGAILGGAASDQLDKLDKFGESLGIAFQIRDDILDKEERKNSLQELNLYKNKALEIIPQITKDKKMSKLLQQLVQDLVTWTK